MGAAQSKNVANAVATITNQVTTDTVGNIDNITTNQVSTFITNSKIELSGDLNIENTQKNIYVSHQIAKQMQTSQISNDISQKMMQEAISKMGAMGVGYASAENSASMFASASSIVKNSLSATVGNFSSFTGTTVIDNSYIKANNLNIKNITSANYVTDQTLDNSQVSTIDNKISQDISQKASATVQGLTGLLLALAILIGVIAYALTKPLNTGAVKMIISGVLVVGIIILFIWMFTVHTPPLFAEPVIVSPYVPVSQNGNCSDEVIDIKIQSLNLNQPPLKYLYTIYTVDTQDTLGCLLTLACAKAVVNPKDPNRGYNYITFDRSENIDQNYRDLFGITLPNIFTKGDKVYFVKNEDIVDSFTSDKVYIENGDKAKNDAYKIVLPNFDGFIEFCTNDKNAIYARFVLCAYLGIPNYYFINDDDPIIDMKNNVGRANALDKNYQIKITNFTRFNPPDKMLGGCTIEGAFGICNSGSYKVTQNFKKWGMYIFILLIIGIILYIFLKKGKGKTQIKTQKKNKLE